MICDDCLWVNNSELNLWVSTVGRILIAWFNDCVLGKSGQIVTPMIAMVDPVVYVHVYESTK